MTNKQIALLGIIGFAVFMVSYLSDPTSEGLLYYGGLIAFYVGVIWGWVRLFK
ncbi:hypothetical protein M0R04_13680 [Candidatus Dojkabacteria bacterium]|jgi:hypothetical protein|nr:hypothetical protein [Candidatus Dojkabacteria bacterium]